MADRVLGGRYTVQDKIGIGGMATVYRGLDNVLGRTVAIKTMLPQYAADPSFAARFKQEAQAAAALQSPYIVGVYDWGRDQDTYYIIMEYLRGTDLKTGIRKHGALDCRKVAQIGSQICQALSVAHKHDIIHRDIKPQNIMVQPDGNIKVMDFGIARAKNSHLTQDNSVLGTAHYVSPEQTQGKELGPTSDLYSLGIVMYEASTGKVPFDGDDAITVALKQVNEQPVPPSKVNPNVDATLEGIILKCMQKNPADRFQTADELRRVLNDYLAGRIVNLGEATSLLTAAPTAQMGRNGRTQSMAPAVAAVKPVQSTGRIPTVQPARPQHGALHAQEEPPSSGRGKKAAIVIGIIAAIAVVAAIAFTLFGGNREPATQSIPDLSGMTEAQARAKVSESDGYFTVGTVSTQNSDTVDKGKLISQDPSAGTQSPKGTTINLVISDGPEPVAQVSVPDLYKMSDSDAQTALSNAKLSGTLMGSEPSDDVPEGRVTRQSVKANTQVDEGTTVQYWTSSGPDTVSVPGVLGSTYAEASNTLSSAGFTVKRAEDEYSSEYASGQVMAQDVTGQAKKGATVTLTVSKGPKPTPATTTATSPTTQGISSSITQPATTKPASPSSSGNGSTSSNSSSDKEAASDGE